MARLFTSGWEVNTTDSGHEWSTISGSPSTSSNVVRSGGRAAQVSSLASATRKGWAVQFQTSLTSGPFWASFWLRVDTLPTAANTIFAWIAGASAASVSVNDGQFRLGSDGTVALFADDSQVGSASAALDLTRWHELSMEYDNSPASGSKVIRAYLDGQQFAAVTTSTNIGGTANGVAFGGNLRSETQATGVWYFDDARVNDSSGSNQNSMPPSGRIIIMQPDGTGDSNDWNNTSNAAGSTSNWNLVDENPPDDATTMVQTGTLNAVDLWAMESSGVGIPDTVNVVSVFARRRNNVADAVTAVAAVVQKTTGGTQAVGGSTVPNTTSWRTGGPDTSSTVRDPGLTLYADPDGSPWTQSTLGTMQAGVKLVTAGTNRIQVSTLHATVDYTPAPARRFYLANEAAGYTPATIRGAWDDSSATLTRKLGYAAAGAAATAVKSESSATTDYDVLLGRWISDPATVAGALAGYLHWVIGAVEGNTAANMVFHWHLFVTLGDSDVVRGTLRSDYVGSSEWPTLASGRSGANITLTSVDVEVGDRLVLEMGYRAVNTDTSIFNGTIHYGNTGLSDLTSASQNVTTQPGWVELTGAVDIFDPDVVPPDQVEGEGTAAGVAATTGAATRTRNTAGAASTTTATTAAASVRLGATGPASTTAATSASAARVRNAAGSATVTAGTTAAAVRVRNAAGSAATTAATAGAGHVTRGTAGTATTTAASTGSGQVVRRAAAASSTTAGTTAVGIRARNASAAASTAAATTGAATATRVGAASAASTAATTAAGSVRRAATANAAGVAVTAVAAVRVRNATATATVAAGTGGVGSLSGDGGVATGQTAAATTGTARTVAHAVATSAGIAATTAAAARGLHAVGDTTATAATTGMAHATRHGAATATRTAATSGLATSGGGATGTATSAAASTATGQVTRRATGAAGTDADTAAAAARTFHAAGAATTTATTAGTATRTRRAAGSATVTAGSTADASTSGLAGAVTTAASTGTARLIRRAAATAGSIVAWGTATAAVRSVAGTSTAAATTTAVAVVRSPIIRRPDSGTIARPYTGIIHQP